MNSNRYPFLSSGSSSWLIVSGVFIIGFLVRHSFKLKHSGRAALFEFRAILTQALSIFRLRRVTWLLYTPKAKVVAKIRQLI
jgi:uncharacterized membrane protein